MLIGLTGRAGSGKNTVAEMLAGAGGSQRVRIAAFADPLYECVSTITGIPADRLRDRAVKEAVVPWLGKSPRQMLQLLGTEWGRDSVHPEIWVRSLMWRIEVWLDAGDDVIVTDVRFDNEAEAITSAGGEVWRIVRPGWECLAGRTAEHSSEAGVSDTLVARVVDNDGDVDLLRERVSAAII